ncbi:MAG: DUF393 domain-containing protein [Steroidobacteraceae bacterium]|jgi:predicted DCC family thiol-disulfide oxidoreductase YuxK|nr:DUF393 domain-containing protein [Steroidobacteraceae bacterium]
MGTTVEDLERHAAAARDGDPELTVYFDGDCPLCSREIASYRGQRGADEIAWVDVARCAGEALGPGLDRGAALARLHVRRADGSLVDGAAAFTTVWDRLPGYRWLARLAALPGMLPVLEALYSGFLRIRRLWRPPAPTGI